MYIVTDKINKQGYSCTDLVAVAKATDLNYNTITSWFRNNISYKETNQFIITKANHIKSNKGGSKSNNNNPFFH